MKLYSLRVQGLRKHIDTNIIFSDSTFLIGENNVGKSSVLAALDYLLNVKSKIPEEEFYAVADESGKTNRIVSEVILTAEFRCLPEEAKNWRGFRGRILPYNPEFNGDTGLSFIYRKTFTLNSTSPKIEVRQYSKKIREDFAGCKSLADYIAHGIDSDEFPDKLKEIPLDRQLKKTEKDLLDGIDALYTFDNENIDWFENPGGFPQNVLSKLPSLLLIPAQDRQEEISSGTGALQRTLEELFKEIRNTSENYRQAQHFLDQLQEELNPSNPVTEVSKMMTELNGVVAEVFPSASILASTNLSNPDTTIKPTFTIQMSSNISTQASLQGTGMIRSAVFALLRYKSIRDAKRCTEGMRSLIIGFEEPELYLHPNAINMIRGTIYRLAGSPYNQIVCTTHSPYMIDISRAPRQILNSLSICKKKIEGVTGETVDVRPFNVTKEYQNLQDDDKDYVKMLLRVDEVISRSFFVKKVLIVEGDTEQIVINETLPFLPRKIEHAIRSDWHIIRARGKAAIIPLVKYMKSMGIDIYVIHDGDFGVKGAEVFNEPIKKALGDDSKLAVLANCIEDVLGYQVKEQEKPLHAYRYIKEHWRVFDNMSPTWRECVEKIFNAGKQIDFKNESFE